jgi:hypothetical protein
LAYTARFGNGRLGAVAHHCNGFARHHELPQINGYPFHPSEQDMISAAGIKDQELTIIVSMMLIELALLRLSRAAFFKRLALLDTQGLELLIALLPRVGGRRAGRLASVRRASSKAPNTPNLETERERITIRS